MVKHYGLVDKLVVRADGSGQVGHAGSSLLAGVAGYFARAVAEVLEVSSDVEISVADAVALELGGAVGVDRGLQGAERRAQAALGVWQPQFLLGE